MEQNNSRETWGSKLGFILACIGSAIGLGNIWMFPWRLGQFGGGAFLIPYLIFVFLLGTTGLMGEFALGRSQQRGAIGAFEKVFKEKKLPGGTLIGTIPVIAQTGVFIFYSVVVGWVLRFFVFALRDEFKTMDINTAFGNFAGHTESIGWTIGAILITLCIVILGVKSGIEKVSKVIMPALFGIFIMLMINTLLLKGSMEGIKYLLLPDWSYLLKIDTWVMALGQAFFTVSLGGAGMVVLGSYLPKEMDIPSSAFSTALFDTLAALMAAFIIIPAAFAFDLDPGAGPQLLFITMPRIFNMMGGGYVFGILFFLCLVFAAISTEIVLMEVAVEAFMDKLGMKRTSSALLTACIGIGTGCLLSTNMEWFGKFADMVAIYLLPFSALLAAIAFFWIYGIDKARNEINRGAKIKMVKHWEILAKYIFVFTATAVLILGILYGGIG
ncbi:MAG: sodium-dependent transporter [Anaeromicrobium sp.]|jgi:NSS family neurotransmitter:Na+ symporter|uniref:sodium-dependent transporter n=1 Tax=Anaeromicrobium sp. TaxID=1929132 RepID=UPI0025D3094A|nr:sodium-dependent transporter [Anaeromicrobium sp.]MCT4596229.1 sodium-dependent transporter [Anaeromicrobium sp.]